MSYGPYLSKITLPNGSTYDLKDQEARDLIEAIVAGGLSFKVSTNAATTPEGIEWDNKGTKITGTLVASAATRPYVYLVPHKVTAGTGGAGDKVDFYREYVTVNFGTEEDPSFAWEFLGDTDIDLSGLGDMAWVDTASGSTTLSTADSASFSNGTASVSATYTPAGSVNVTLSQTATAAALTKADYTPAGSVSVTLDQTGTAATLTKADYTPAGSVSKPNVTVTDDTADVYGKKTDGSVTAGQAATFTRGTFSGGSFTQGTDQFTAPTFTATVAEGSETLAINFTAGSFTQGNDTFTPATHGADTFNGGTPTAVVLPTFEKKTFVTGVTAELASAPTFTGTKAENALVTGVSYDKASVQAASFTGTKAVNALVTGVNYDKASVNEHTFSGTEATISSSGTATGTVSLTKTDKTVSITVHPDSAGE